MKFLVIKLPFPISINCLPSQPKFGGTIVDIVSREIRTPEEQAEAMDAVKNTILEIVLIVVIGYG